MTLFRRKSRPLPDDRSPKNGVKYKDLLVLSTLVEHGADLTQPRHVLYYLYFDAAESAQHATEAATEASFLATVEEPRPEHPGQWRLVCERTGVVLDADTVRSHGDFFDGLASRFSGEYDGWEASVR